MFRLVLGSSESRIPLQASDAQFLAMNSIWEGVINSHLNSFQLLSRTVLFSFKDISLMKCYACFILPTKHKKSHGLQIGGDMPDWGYHLSLHCIIEGFFRQVCHEVRQTAACIHCWGHHCSNFNELQIERQSAEGEYVSLNTL